jgi:hypothetical protein
MWTTCRSCGGTWCRAGRRCEAAGLTGGVGRCGGGDHGWDLFEAAGRYLGTLPAGAPFPAAFLAGDRMVAIERDSPDVPSLSLYRVDRGEPAQEGGVVPGVSDAGRGLTRAELRRPGEAG